MKNIILKRYIFAINTTYLGIILLYIAATSNQEISTKIIIGIIGITTSLIGIAGKPKEKELKWKYYQN